MNIEVLWDNVVVELDNTTGERNQGGIILPATYGDTLRGKIMKAGPGQYLMNGFLVEMPVKEGQYIGFEKTAGKDVQINGIKYKLLRATEIQFIFDDVNGEN